MARKSRISLKRLLRTRRAILRRMKKTNQKGEMNDLAIELDLIDQLIAEQRKKAR